MSPRRTPGTRPVCSTNSERLMSSRPSGTATQSLGSPVAFEASNTLPATPARSTLDVRGTTCACQRSTPRTSSEETTTQGRRLSQSIQNAPHALPRRRPRRPLDNSPRLRSSGWLRISQHSVGEQMLPEAHLNASRRVATKLICDPRREGTSRLSMIGTASSGTLIVLLGMYLLFGCQRRLSLGGSQLRQVADELDRGESPVDDGLAQVSELGRCIGANGQVPWRPGLQRSPTRTVACPAHSRRTLHFRARPDSWRRRRRSSAIRRSPTAPDS